MLTIKVSVLWPAQLKQRSDDDLLFIMLFEEI